ncbi:MAG: ABC transporter permease [Syntrophomonadaceae bacterium]|nr:ABC transporter permease [Syntrophomonadaceae bacterium]
MIKPMRERDISSQLILLLLLLLVGAYLSWQSPYFMTLSNLRNVLDSVSIRIILALGMTFVIATGGIDLSAGSIVSLSAVVMGLLMTDGCSTPQVIMLGLAAATLLGVVNGLMIHLTGINAFIITLGTYSAYRGLALILTSGLPIYNFPASFKFWGSGNINSLNPPIIIMVVLVIAAAILLRRSKWGQYALALGGNGEALRRLGVKVGFYRVSVYAFAGLMAGLVGLIVTARVGTAEPNAGLSMELDAITAVIMGGTLLTGGKASVGGTVIACLLLALIRNGLTLLSVSSYYQQFIIGTLLLIAVIIAEIREKNKVRL